MPVRPLFLLLSHLDQMFQAFFPAFFEYLGLFAVVLAIFDQLFLFLDQGNLPLFCLLQLVFKYFYLD